MSVHIVDLPERFATPKESQMRPVKSGFFCSSCIYNDLFNFLIIIFVLYFYFIAISFASDDLIIDNEIKSIINSNESAKRIIKYNKNTICLFGKSTKKEIYEKNIRIDDDSQGLALCEENICTFIPIDREKFMVMYEYDKQCIAISKLSSLSIRTNLNGIRYLDVGWRR